MAQRYCTNCGAELREDDSFCGKCGRPVHEVATVSTPEADVPVPPPPPVEGAGADGAAAGSPTRESGNRDVRHPYLVGCLSIIGLVVLAVILGTIIEGGGGNGGGKVAEKPKQEHKAAQQEQPPKREPQPQQEEQAQGVQQVQQGGGGQEPERQIPSFSDGTYQVGTDVPPGTYRTREGSPNCYYERLRDFTGGMNSILANANTYAPAIVTIRPTDAGFNSQGCGTWTKDLSAITARKTSLARVLTS